MASGIWEFRKGNKENRKRKRQSITIRHLPPYQIQKANDGSEYYSALWLVRPGGTALKLVGTKNQFIEI